MSVWTFSKLVFLIGSSFPRKLKTGLQSVASAEYLNGAEQKRVTSFSIILGPYGRIEGDSEYRSDGFRNGFGVFEKNVSNENTISPSVRDAFRFIPTSITRAGRDVRKDDRVR